MTEVTLRRGAPPCRRDSTTLRRAVPAVQERRLLCAEVLPAVHEGRILCAEVLPACYKEGILDGMPACYKEGTLGVYGRHCSAQSAPVLTSGCSTCATPMHGNTCGNGVEGVQHFLPESSRGLGSVEHSDTVCTADARMEH